MIDLTDMQVILLTEFDKHIKRVGKAPSINELSVMINVPSMRALDYLSVLERKGLIARKGQKLTITQIGYKALEPITTGKKGKEERKGVYVL